MQWQDLAPLVATAAPTLGKLLGASLPLPFGSAIGQYAGEAIAAAIGTPGATPDQVAATISSTHPDAVAAQLAEAEAEAKAKWQALAQSVQAEATVGVAQVQAVGNTQQAELVNGSWYQRLWRPTAMFVWVATWPIQLGTILYHIGTHDAAAISGLATVVNSLALWNAGPAALAGVYSWNRTQEKIAASS